MGTLMNKYIEDKQWINRAIFIFIIDVTGCRITMETSVSGCVLDEE